MESRAKGVGLQRFSLSFRVLSLEFRVLLVCVAFGLHRFLPDLGRLCEICTEGFHGPEELQQEF